MQNSTVMFILFVFDQNRFFEQIWSQNSNILFEDTMKGFENFKNKKVYKVMLFEM